MNIGELARQVGVAPSKLRFLEASGLLKPQRLANGYRSYGEASVELTRTILQAQSFGFTHSEISAAFLESGGRKLRCDLAIKALQSKLGELDVHMKQVRALRARIRKSIAELEQRRAA